MQNNNSNLDPASEGFWQKLPQESPDAFAAFTVYLELGCEASLPLVAEKTGKTYQAVRHLSWRYHWFERASAWHQHLSDNSLGLLKRNILKQTELACARDQIRRGQEWELSQLLSMFCSQTLNKFLSEPQGKVAAYELAPLLRLASQSAQRATAPLPQAPEDFSANDDAQTEADLDKILGEEPKPDAAQGSQSNPSAAESALQPPPSAS